MSGRNQGREGKKSLPGSPKTADRKQISCQTTLAIKTEGSDLLER
jgi:hypothetical protein